MCMLGHLGEKRWEKEMEGRRKERKGKRRKERGKEKVKGERQRKGKGEKKCKGKIEKNTLGVEILKHTNFSKFVLTNVWRVAGYKF